MGSESGQKRQRGDEVDAKAERKAARKQARLAAAEPAVATQESSAVSAAEVANFLAAHEITVHEPNAPPPCMRLDAAPFPAAIVQRLCAQKGFTIPSPVQAGTWPLACKVSSSSCLHARYTVSGADIECVSERGAMSSP